MKPKPFSSLNHLTVPVSICVHPLAVQIHRGASPPGPSRRTLARGQTCRWPRRESSAACESRLSGAMLQERAHAAAEVLRSPEVAGDARHLVVGALDPALQVGAQHLLGGG